MRNKNLLVLAVLIVSAVSVHAEAGKKISPLPVVTVSMQVDGVFEETTPGSHTVSWSSTNADSVSIGIYDGFTETFIDGLPTSGAIPVFIPEPVSAAGGYVEVIAISDRLGSTGTSVFIQPDEIVITKPVFFPYWQEGRLQQIDFEFVRFDANVFRAYLVNSLFPSVKYPLSLADLPSTGREFVVTPPSSLIQQMIADFGGGLVGEAQVRERFSVVVDAIKVDENGEHVVSTAQSLIAQISPADTVIAVKYPDARTVVQAGDRLPVVWSMNSKSDVAITFAKSENGVLIGTPGIYTAFNAGFIQLTAPNDPGQYVVQIEEVAKGGGQIGRSDVFTVNARPVSESDSRIKVSETQTDPTGKVSIGFDLSPDLLDQGWYIKKTTLAYQKLPGSKVLNKFTIQVNVPAYEKMGIIK